MLNSPKNERIRHFDKMLEKLISEKDIKILIDNQKIVARSRFDLGNFMAIKIAVQYPNNSISVKKNRRNGVNSNL